MMTQKSTTNILQDESKNNSILNGINWKTTVLIIVLNVIFQLSESYSIIFGFIGAALFLVSLLIIDTDQYVYYYVAIACSRRLMEIYNIPLLSVITIIFFAQRYILSENIYRSRINKQVLLSFVLLLLYSMRFFFLNYSFSAPILVIKLFFCILMLADCFNDCKTKEDVTKTLDLLIFYFSLGVTIACTVSLLINSSTGNLERFSLSEENSTNILSIYAASGISVISTRLFSEISKTMKIVMVVMIAPLLYVGFLTQSRTFIVMLAIIFAWVMAFGVASERYRNIVVKVFIAVMVGVILFLIFGKNTSFYELMNKIIERFTNPKDDDITNGRDIIWKLYMARMLGSAKFMFFGNDGVTPSPAGGSMAHNMYLEMFYTYGLVGLVVIIWIYATLFVTLKKRFAECGFNKSMVFGTLPFILVWVAGMGSHTLLGTMPTIEFFLGVCCIYCTQFSYEKKKPDRDSDLIDAGNLTRRLRN